MARRRKNLPGNSLAIIEQGVANGISGRKLAKALGMSLDTWLKICRETDTEPFKSEPEPFQAVREA